MRRIEKVIQYFVLFFCMMILLLVLNVVFIGVVEVPIQRLRKWQNI